jgi:hypothetical protein
MKKIIFVLVLAILCMVSLPTFAQLKLVAESTTFEEPEDGVSRIVQMKNGNTFYIHLTVKEGIDLRIYNAAHKEIVSTSVIPSFGKLKAGEFQNVFEVKNDIIFFVSEFQDNAPILYRLIFDGTTGKLKEDKLIAQCKRHGGMLATSVIDAFNVKKAVVGESYAVEVYNIFEDDKDKRVEIIQYGDDNNETKRTFLITGDDDDFKFFVYMDMQVIDENKVVVFLFNGKEKYFYNTKKGRMVMASVDRRSANVMYTPVNLPEKIKFSRCTTRYVPKTKKIYLLLLELNEKDRDNYDNYLVKINTENNTMETKLVIDTDEKLNEKYKEKFSLRKDYMAMYKSLLVYDDGSYTIIYEERYSESTPATGFGMNKQGTTIYYSGKIMIMNYNSKDEVVSGYVVPKLYNENNYSQYKSPLYIAVGNNRYMAINDTERNNDVKKDKFVTIVGVSDSDAFLYKLEGDELVPKRDYIFGSGEAGHNLASFKISDYNAATNTLVTLKLNKKSPTNKAVSVVWMQPQ